MKSCGMNDNQDLCLTLFNGDFGLVAERRGLNLTGEDQELLYLDVASKMEPDSLRVDGVAAVEVNYEYALVNKEDLLAEYIGETVFLLARNAYEKRPCRLLAAGSTLILEDVATREVLIDPHEELVLPNLSGDFVLRPQLILRLRPAVARQISLTYLTKGLNWAANYVVEIGEQTLALEAWVEIRNEAGITFKDARLQLLAGTVYRVDDDGGQLLGLDSRLYLSEKSEVFTEKSFSDYYLYALDGTTTLKENQVKQVKLFSAANVNYRRYYQVPTWSEEVQVVVELCNNAESGLGRPLPAGTMKIYQSASDGRGLTFTGEDRISHTSKDESIRLKIGTAFDLQCKRRCLGQYNDRGSYKEHWRIMLKNHKQEAALIYVRQQVPVTAGIENVSHFWERCNDTAVEFVVDLAAGQTEIIEFTTVSDERDIGC